MEKTNIYTSISINVYHSMTLRNADPDLNENRGGRRIWAKKKARIGGFPYPYSPPREGASEQASERVPPGSSQYSFHWHSQVKMVIGGSTVFLRPLVAVLSNWLLSAVNQRFDS